MDVKSIYIKRTVNRLLAILISLMMLITNCNIFVKASDKDIFKGELYSKGIALIDAKSGRLLYGRNENLTLPMASTTKILTCIIALENSNIDGEVQVSENAQRMPKVKLGMQAGEKYIVKDLLYSLMLESHNDSAVAIAEYVSGDVKKFADKMNEKAREIGCEKSYFITPNGLDAAENTSEENNKKVHSTTAYELAKIMAYCIEKSEKKEEFLKITQTQSYSFKDVAGKRNFACNNHNAFLNMMEGAISGKTGFTNDAGYCYVGALRQQERTFVVALLASGWPNNKSYKWKDTLKLMKYAVDNYHYKEVKKEEIKGISIPNGIDYYKNVENNPYENAVLELKEGGEDNIRILISKDEGIVRKVVLKENICLPVKKGENMGKVIYYIKSGESLEQLHENEIFAGNTVEKQNYNIYCDFIFKQFLL